MVRAAKEPPGRLSWFIWGSKSYVAPWAHCSAVPAFCPAPLRPAAPPRRGVLCFAPSRPWVIRVLDSTIFFNSQDHFIHGPYSFVKPQSQKSHPPFQLALGTTNQFQDARWMTRVLRNKKVVFSVQQRREIRASKFALINR